jgi:hypothetical protein
MEREEYLEIKEYKRLHEYISSILIKIELDVTEYIEKKGYQNLLVKKSLVYAKTQPIFNYSIYFDFFEEVEEIGDKETQLSFVVVLTFNKDKSTFNICADISSIYKVIHSGWFKEITELPVIAENYFEEVNIKFIEVLEEFFNKELKYRSNE